MSLIWDKTAVGICDALSWDKGSVERIYTELGALLDNWDNYKDEEETV